jgi:hypothetical protein
LLLFVTLLPSPVPLWENTDGKLNGLNMTFRLALIRSSQTCSISIRKLLLTASPFGESETAYLLLLQVVNLVSLFVP